MRCQLNWLFIPTLSEGELQGDVFMGIIVLGKGDVQADLREDLAIRCLWVRRRYLDVHIAAVCHHLHGAEEKALNFELPHLDDRAGPLLLQDVAILLGGQEGADRTVLLVPLQGLVEVVAIFMPTFRKASGDHPARVVVDHHASSPLAALDLEELGAAHRGDRPDEGVVRRILREATARLLEDRVVKSIEWLNGRNIARLDGATRERSRPAVAEILPQERRVGRARRDMPPWCLRHATERATSQEVGDLLDGTGARRALMREALGELTTFGIAPYGEGEEVPTGDSAVSSHTV